MNPSVGSLLDLLIVDFNAYNFQYASLTTQTPFAESYLFEARGTLAPSNAPSNDLFVNSNGQVLSLSTDSLLELPVKENTTNYITAFQHPKYVVVAPKHANRCPFLLGTLQGLFTRQCTALNVYLNSAVAAGIWTASGNIPGLGYAFILGQIYDFSLSANMYANGQQYSLKAIIAHNQIYGVWQGITNAGAFAFQPANSFNALNLQLESTECLLPPKMNGSFSQNNISTPFSLYDVKVTSNFFTANGKEYARTFTLQGPIVANRARLIKKYNDSTELITLHLNVAKDSLQGVWFFNDLNGPVQFGI